MASLHSLVFLLFSGIHPWCFLLRMAPLVARGWYEHLPRRLFFVRIHDTMGDGTRFATRLGGCTCRICGEPCHQHNGFPPLVVFGVLTLTTRGLWVGGQAGGGKVFSFESEVSFDRWLLFCCDSHYRIELMGWSWLFFSSLVMIWAWSIHTQPSVEGSYFQRTSTSIFCNNSDWTHP